jgi:hypothetical protein
MLFLFVEHAFDVGDLLELEAVQYRVKKIDLQFIVSGTWALNLGGLLLLCSGTLFVRTVCTVHLAAWHVLRQWQCLVAVFILWLAAVRSVTSFVLHLGRQAC